MRYEKVWEGSDLFGYDVIDILVHIGKRHAVWRLYINHNMEADKNGSKQINSSNKWNVINF